MSETTTTTPEPYETTLARYRAYFDNLVAQGEHPLRAMQKTTVKVRNDIPGFNSALEVRLLYDVLDFA